MPSNGFYPLELRVQIFTLYGIGVKTAEIASTLEVPQRTVQQLIKRTKERGYKPEECLRVKKEFVEDSKRTGRLRNDRHLDLTTLADPTERVPSETGLSY